MRKISYALMVLMLAVCLTACGSSENSDSPDGAVTTQTEVQEEESSETGDTQAEQQENEESAEQETAQADEADEAGEDLLELARSFEGEPVEDLIEAGGEPESSDYAPSCLGEGEDGNLYYDGFTVYTYRDDSGEVVNYVE